MDWIGGPVDWHREFAVDLEHHSYRTYQGFTCLMQISTRERDYVVDTIALRASIRGALAAHFLNPHKLKAGPHLS